MPNYNNALDINNTTLQEILDVANSLPDKSKTTYSNIGVFEFGNHKRLFIKGMTFEEFENSILNNQHDEFNYHIICDSNGVYFYEELSWADEEYLSVDGTSPVLGTDLIEERIYTIYEEEW